MALGESIFLFVWAVISNAKEFLVDYVDDVTTMIIPSASSKKRLNARRKKNKQNSAYFRRVKHQMGIFTPEKEKVKRRATRVQALSSDEEDQINLEATVDNLLNFSNNSASEDASRLEDLEAQLLVLKKEMAFLTNTNHVNALTSSTSRKSQSPQQQQQPPVVNQASQQQKRQRKSLKPVQQQMVVEPKVTTTAPPPPPPPMPPAMNATPSVVKVAPPPPPVPLHINTPTRSQQSPASSKPRMERSMSIADMIKNSKKENLKSTTVKRSPGGTPVKGKETKGGFQNELFAAIRHKFKSHHEDSESDADDDFASPGYDKENKSPAVNQSKHSNANHSPIHQGRVLRQLSL